MNGPELTGFRAICVIIAGLSIALCFSLGVFGARAYAGEAQDATKLQTASVANASKAKAVPVQARIKACVSKRAGSITVKAAPVKGAVKYQAKLAQDRGFHVSKKVKASKTNICTFNLLDSGQTYYVTMRVCKKIDGKAVWGPWSKAVQKKAKVLTLGFVSLHSSPSGSGVNWWKNCGFKIVGITSPKDPDLKKVDGVLVPGGRDMNPKYYGEKKHPRTVLEDPKIDALKLAVIKKCAKIEMPLLGVCGGEQVLNVALGGSLKQHIPTGYHQGWRKVRIAKGSWLYKMFGSTESVHLSLQQCAKRLGKGLIATQWDAKDGYIEALEHVSLPLYGVQWHPENMGSKGRKVARSFGKICMKHAL